MSKVFCSNVLQKPTLQLQWMMMIRAAMGTRVHIWELGNNVLW